MLIIFVIASCVLMACAGPPISGYSLGTLSGGRGQEYSNYRSGGFVAMKDAPSDLGEQLGGSPYGSASSHRHVVAGPSHSSSGGYSSDSGYSDGSHSNVYGGQSSGNPEILTSLQSSSYSSNDASHGSQSELGASYSTVQSSGGLGGYSASGGNNGNHVASSLIEYSDGSSSQGPSTLALTSSNSERNPGEYSSPSHQTPSYVSYSHGAPKTSAYTSSGANHRVHGPGYSSQALSFMAGHHGQSSSSPYYPPESSHSPMSSSGPNFLSGQSLNSILAGMHSGGPSNYVHASSHRPSPNHIFATSSNVNPSYSSRGPSSGYYSNSPFPRGGGKIILVKESGGGHATHMYPDQHNFSGMFGAPGSGYKIRSVSSGPSYGPSVGSGYSSSPGHSSGNHGSSLFGFL